MGFRYNDLYYPEASYNKWDETALIYSLHAVNHVLKCRPRNWTACLHLPALVAQLVIANIELVVATHFNETPSHNYKFSRIQLRIILTR